MLKIKAINFLIALKHEALPIINYFNLTIHDKKQKKIYSNQEKKIFLIISGIGADNAKNSVISFSKLYHWHKHAIWVNVGLAGHVSDKIGKLYEVKKIISSINKNVFFANSFYNKLPVLSSYCVNVEEKKYNKKYLYDMESYGFMEALESLTIKENIFIFKIVSDNQHHKPNCYKKFAISSISKNIEKINKILSQYRINSLESFHDIKPILNIIKKKYSVTFYNEKKLEKMLVKILTIKNKKEISNKVLESQSLGCLIQKLENYLKEYFLKI